MTTAQKSKLPTAEDLRAQARDALSAVGSHVSLGEPGADGLQASTPITGEVLFTVAESTPEQAEAAIAQAAQAFTTWRTTPAPVRGALVARLGELLVEHKADLATLVTLEAGKITCEVIDFNRFGNVHLNVRPADLDAAGLDAEAMLSIEAVSGSAAAKRGNTYADFAAGEYGVLFDPRGWLTIVRGNPASALDGLGLSLAAPVWLTAVRD